MDKDYIDFIDKQLAPKGSAERDKLFRNLARQIAQMTTFYTGTDQSVAEVHRDGLKVDHVKVGEYGQSNLRVPPQYIATDDRRHIHEIVGYKEDLPIEPCPECGHTHAQGYRIIPVAGHDFNFYGECKQCYTKMWVRIVPRK